MEEIKKERAILKGKFHRKCKIFNASILENSSVVVLKKLMSEIHEIFQDLELVNSKLISSLGPDFESEIEVHEHYIEELDFERVKIQSLLANVCDIEINRQKSNEVKVKVRAVEPPTFNGNIREWPTFKHDFERLMVAAHGKDPYVLRQCLSGNAGELVRGITDYETMITRLEQKYGDKTRIIDSVLAEIKSLKPVPEGLGKKFVELVNTIERGWLDLNKLGLSEEMNNLTNVSAVEKLLPFNLKREWALLKQSLKPEESTFAKLIEFLVRERYVVQYIEDENRSQGCKTFTHHTQCEENVDLKHVLDVVKQVQADQVNYQKQVNEFMINAANALSNYKPHTVQSVEPKPNNGLKFGCWFHGSNNHKIAECSVFIKLNSQSKMEALRKHGVCFCCLQIGHTSKNCPNKRFCELKGDGKEMCSRLHHPVLHDLFSRNNVVPLMNNMISREGVLLMMSYVKGINMDIPTLWDSGSNISMITHRMARRLGLKGSDINLSVTKIGNESRSLSSKIYKVPLVDAEGNLWEIEACGIMEITSEVPKIDLSKVLDILDASELKIDRPWGKIELLIGTDYAGLMPIVIKTVGNLQLMKNAFGYCIRGSPSSELMSKLNGAIIRVNHSNCSYKVEEIDILPLKGIGKQIEDFLSVEGLGVQCSPKCGGCKCGNCPLTGEYTLKEERELKLINDGLKYDVKEKCFHVTYPFVKDPSNLPNNYYAAKARLQSLENRLKRNGAEYAQKYCDQVNDMISRKVARKLSQVELDTYQGPVFYLPHHEVMKPESESTPLRIVFNSSASYMGISLNDCLAKGPDILTNMMGILLRFRQYPVAIVGDIKKMYNSVHISEIDQHTHRFLWRSMNTEMPPEQYMLTRVTFGDKPSSAIAILALRRAAQMIPQYSETGNKIIRDTYVDDICISIPSLHDAKMFMNQTEEILDKGGFKIKYWIISGDSPQDSEGKNVTNSGQEKVLGLIWNSVADHFRFKIKINFSRKVRNVRTGPNLTVNEIEASIPQKLTRRMVLSQIALIFDPLGFLCPFTLKAKILIRQLTSSGGLSKGERLGWDDPMSQPERKLWKMYFEELYEVEGLHFPRCLKPTNATGDPGLIIFSDASSVAVGCCAYVRWKLSTGQFISKLVAAKNKLAPLKHMSIPRLELCGAVMACRLKEFIEKEMNFQFEFVKMVTDSSIVRSQITNDSLRFNSFVAGRISEIQGKSKGEEWYWIASEHNPADITTRPVKPEQLDVNSVWQKGPKYMTFSVSEWPLSQENSLEIPDVAYGEVMAKTVHVFNDIIDVNRFGSYNKLLRITARVLKACRNKSLLELTKDITASDIQKALDYWIDIVQKGIPHDWKLRYSKLGPSVDERGVVVVGSRLSPWLQCNWNRNHLILLLSNHPFTYLYLRHLHNINHGGLENTLVKLQTKFWVPGARRMIRSIKRKCITCRKLDREIIGQCMSDLPNERIEPAPPFYNTAVDIFGPFLIKDTVKRRTKGKVYGVVFNCLVSRAVYIDLVEGYDTTCFLVTMKRFVSVRGFPKAMYSDGGTQLMAANKELKSMMEKWNRSDIIEFGSEQGMTWYFNKSADAPWQNGCSESLIKLIKRALSVSVGASTLTFGELQTAFFEVANLLNSRPIGIKPGSDITLGMYLCPNDLLLGRSSIEAPIGIWDQTGNFRKSINYIQAVVTSFWKKWQRDFFPTLIVRQKWHTEKRNLKVGDIVLLQDCNTVKGVWKLAEIVTTDPGRDGWVRNVSVRYKLQKPGLKYTGASDYIVKRSAHKLVVILPIEEQTNCV